MSFNIAPCVTVSWGTIHKHAGKRTSAEWKIENKRSDFYISFKRFIISQRWQSQLRFKLTLLCEFFSRKACGAVIHLRPSSKGRDAMKNKTTRHIFCGEIWMNKMLFIHFLSRCVVYKGIAGVESAHINKYTYKPYYSPHFVSVHSINSCVSENCKNVKHGWVRGQTRQLETIKTKRRSENLRWELVETVTTNNVFKTGFLDLVFKQCFLHR